MKQTSCLQVIESTGVVVTPYMEYPQLLGMLLQMLSEGSPQARLEVLKVSPKHQQTAQTSYCMTASDHAGLSSSACIKFCRAISISAKRYPRLQSMVK